MTRARYKEHKRRSGPVVRVNDEPVCQGHCGTLGWTIEVMGRISHKHSCPLRVDDWCQTHPQGCPTP